MLDIVAPVGGRSVCLELTAVTLGPDEFSRFVDALDGAPVVVAELVDLFSQPSRIPQR
jgi:uncharacterized protein (DUF1778 family)